MTLLEMRVEAAFDSGGEVSPLSRENLSGIPATSHLVVGGVCHPQKSDSLPGAVTSARQGRPTIFLAPEQPTSEIARAIFYPYGSDCADG